MLSRQPAFRGVKDDRRQLPSVRVMEPRYTANRTKKTITVSGRVRSNGTPVFAIVADESDARPGEYWTKHYVGAVENDGRFSVTIDDPRDVDGEAS